MTFTKDESLNIIHELGEMERCIPDLIRITSGKEELDFMEGYLEHFHKVISIIDDAIIRGVK